jgi:glycosyltransferase involved in cell wall biosynthesis
MKAAVILSTYNSPERLAPTIAGYAVQSVRDFEIIVADDGSTEDTQALLTRLAKQYGRPIKHVWHPDRGFRKCRILNQAVCSTTADYLIFSDGDCIPRRDFVASHLAHARANRFLSGGYFKLPEALNGVIQEQDILAGRVTDPEWLRTHGVASNPKLWKLSAHGARAEWLNRFTPTRATWNGHNSSGWRSDVLRVNGFDERMAYWAQDREFGERLVNAGIRGVQIRYSAICVHLEHDRPYRTDASRARNKAIRTATRRNQVSWSEHGIVKKSAYQDMEQPDALTIPAADIAVRDLSIIPHPDFVHPLPRERVSN